MQYQCSEFRMPQESYSAQILDFPFVPAQQRRDCGEEGNSRRPLGSRQRSTGKASPGFLSAR